MKMCLGCIMEVGNSRPCKDHLTDCRSIAGPTFQQVAQMDRTQLVLVGSRDAIVPYGHQGDTLRRAFVYRANRSLGRNECASIEFRSMPCRHDPLSTSAGALDNCQPFDVSLRSLKGRVAEVKTRWSTTANLAHAEIANTSAAQGQSLFDFAHHNDLGGPASKNLRRGRERPEHVDYHN